MALSIGFTFTGQVDTGLPDTVVDDLLRSWPEDRAGAQTAELCRWLEHSGDPRYARVAMIRLSSKLTSLGVQAHYATKGGGTTVRAYRRSDLAQIATREGMDS